MSLVGPNTFQWWNTHEDRMMISKTYYSLFREGRRLKKQKLSFFNLQIICTQPVTVPATGSTVMRITRESVTKIIKVLK